MLTKDFTYFLPESLIARYPVPNRTDSRLLALEGSSGAIADYKFSDLVSLLMPGDLLVLNDTKVLPARLLGYKESGGKVEVLIERIISEHQAWVQIRASKVPKPGSHLVLNGNIQVRVLEFARDRGMFLLAFDTTTPIIKILNQYGEIPLPPYMERGAEVADKDRYQTVYANPIGSVAAPTAGLHFSQELLEKIQSKGVELGRLTLHVGAGTFQPVRVKNIADHKMHSEYMQVGQEICDQIAATKVRGGRVICVGTTSVRALESAALAGSLQPMSGDTDIFITPGFKFKVVDCLLTNFHVPESTLLMLVCAFAGKDKMLKAYQHAIENNYRFYSYGDAMLIIGKSNEI
jgi:S-adenosylmethionine:tRNA ribosyltransferase-isomerase